MHADVVETAVCAGQVELLADTSQCTCSVRQYRISAQCGVVKIRSKFVQLQERGTIYKVQWRGEVGDIHAEIIQTAQYGGQVEILLYTYRP